MKHILSLNEFLSDIEKQRLSTIKDNEEYNNDVFDSSDKKKDPNYDIVIANEIPIGDKDPMKKFKKIVARSKYWERKKK